MALRVLGSPQDTPIVVRIFSNYEMSDFERIWIREGIESELGEVRIEFGGSGRTNLAVILNYSLHPSLIFGKGLTVIKVVQEPRVEGSPFHTFTKWHDPAADVVLTHNPTASKRERLSLPLLSPHAKTAARLTKPPPKDQLVSAIGSRLTDINFHKQRSEFLDELETDTTIKVFGKGRQFVQEKSDALIPFMYSVAIENSIQKSYVTEKFTDCILAYTIPIYVGAPDVENYFPRDCYLTLDPGNLSAAWSEVKPLLSADDYYRRLPSLILARSLVLDTYHLGREIARTFSTFESRSGIRLTVVASIQTAIYLIAAPLFGLLHLLRRVAPIFSRR